MKRSTYFLILALACVGLAAWGGRALAADEPAKVDGAWDFSSESPRGTNTSTLTIQQDSGTIKGTMKGQRGEAPLQGTIAGNKISFTVTRDTPNGTFTIEYTGTVDGDSMTGTSHSERFDGKWTAKRQAAK